MKKFLLLIALAMTFIVTQASEVFEDGYLKYQVDDNGTVSVIGLSASGKSKSTIEVLDIGWQSSRIIHRIADNAFENCTNIKSVRIGLGCEYIGNRAFYMATNIHEVMIPSSVTYVGKEAFVLMTSCDIKFAGPLPPKFGSKAIIELVPGMVQVISNQAFACTYLYYDGTLKEAGVTLVREPIMGMTYDFFDTAGNKQIGYTALGSFKGDNHTSNIYEVVITACDPFYKTGWDLIPEDITNIIRYPRIVVGIGRDVFKNSDLHTVDLSKLNHLEYIDDGAFEGSTSLESINLGSTVTEIREKAFANTGISSLTLPACLTQYNTTATENCKNFTSYNVDSNHPLYKTYFGLLYSKDNKTLISFPSGLDYSQILEDNRKVWSPEIEKIGWCAFAGVNSIKQVYVPYGVKSVDRPFEHCNQLLSLKLPATVYDYGDKAYFPCHECSSFQAMAVNSRHPHNIYEGGISMPVKTLYVPKGCKSAYESDRKWSKFSEIIEGAFDFTQAGFGTSTTMYSVTSTEPVVIDGVQYDGRAELVLANTNSTAGQTLKVADYILDYVKTKKYAVTRINNSIFYDNQTQPFTLTLGANVDSIYNDAFSVACHGTLTQLNLNPKLKFVGTRAFENCGISNNLIFSYGIETIEEEAFINNKIQAMIIPGTIKSIGREAFYNNPLKMVSLNTSVPFNTYFISNGSCKLYVPTGAVNQYKNNSYYSIFTISAGACDFTYNNAGLLNTRYHTTILSNEPVTYDGVTYAGTAKYVYSPANAPGVLSSTTFDGGIASTCKVNGVNKDYLIVEYGDSCLYGATDIMTLPLQNSKAVKRIGKYAFQGTNIASVTMPESLETIDDYAFRNCTKLTQFTLNANLKNLNKGALSGSAVKNALMFHYGIENIGEEAFKNSAIPSLFFPATLKTLGKTAFDGLTKLKYLSLNSETLYKLEPSMTSVPSTCKFYVPTGVTKQYKEAAGWKGLTVSAGACDFTYKNAGLLNTRYHYTITLDYPITYEGETYDGWVKVVYSPANDPGVLSTTTFDPGLYAEYNLYGVNKRYLIHEFGDSCLYGASDIVTLPLENSPYLSIIGKKAFSGTNITSVSLPSGINIGAGALCDCPKLEEVFVPAKHDIGTLWEEMKWNNRWYGHNASNFKCYVKWDRMEHIRSKVDKWPTLDRSETQGYASSFLRGYFVEESADSVVTFSVNHQVDWTNSGINAYILSDYDAAKGIMTATKVDKSKAKEGLLLTGFEKDKIYKLQRPEIGFTGSRKDYLRANVDGDLSLSQSDETSGQYYYWNSDNLTFNHIPATYTVPAGRGYLALESTKDKVMVDLFKTEPDYKLGDVNGDDVVDVDDVNIVINIILGNDNAEKYAGRADVNDDNAIDVDDVNNIINIILGI